jgi:hypothetical protein
MSKGYFVDDRGNEIEVPDDPEEPFPIICGPWPNPNAEAIHILCVSCGADVGISPKGLSYHRENPALRPTLCRRCMYMLTALIVEDK